MSSISVKATTTNNTLILFAATPSTYQSILLSGVVKSLRTDTLGILQPSPTPNTGIQPPLPPDLRPPSYVSPNFDYLTLPRLELQPTQTLVSNVQVTKLTVTKPDGITHTLDDYFINGDFSSPISGSSVGTIQIGELGTSNLKIPQLSLGYGDRIKWQQCWGTVCLTIADCFVLATPVLSTDNGFLKYSLSVGDELALKADSSRVPVTKYCGSPPTTAGEAARIYAETHNLFTRTFPRGHTLLDLSLQTFTNERPFDFLSALYAPTNQDVRTDETGIIIRPRLPFDLNKRVVLTKDLVIEVDGNFTQSYKPTTKLRVKNDYSLINDFELIKTTEKTISGIESNTKPWFQGGYTETVTEKATLGDTEVWSKVITYGYIPTSSFVTVEQYEADPCSPSIIPTTFGIISTKQTVKEYSRHISGSYLVDSEKTWFYSKYLQKTEPPLLVQYNLLDGLKSYSITTYKYTPQFNENVCAKDYVHFTTYTRTETYEENETFTGYRLASDTITEYSVKGTSSLNQDSFVGLEQTWIKTTVSGSYSTADNTFITQPALTESVETPPTANWIRPSISNIIAFKTVTLNAEGSLETKPLEAPFCYTEEQLETFGKRSLRETYGLHQGLSLVIPFYITVNIGDSVLYENNPYIVYNIEINQTLNQSTKTILLSRWIS